MAPFLSPVAIFMLKYVFAQGQYLLPKHCLTALAGRLAECRVKWVKNALIHRFIKCYSIDMSEAEHEDVNAYATFNDFFIRKLKPGIRPITPGAYDVASPADGTVAEIGHIKKDQLFQAKNFHYTLTSLLGGDEKAAQQFDNGSFATLYLAPYNYHRFHMPITGKLIKTTFVPGQLFSVNRTTSEYIPHLYARNERLIAYFETEAGPLAVVMVGAMIVGSIQMTGMDKPARAKQITTLDYPSHPEWVKGQELGYFKLGSTLILLYGNNRVRWSPALQATTRVQVGQFLGDFSKIGA